MISTIERTASTVTQEFVLRHLTFGSKGRNSAPDGINSRLVRPSSAFLACFTTRHPAAVSFLHLENAATIKPTRRSAPNHPRRSPARNKKAHHGQLTCCCLRSHRRCHYRHLHSHYAPQNHVHRAPTRPAWSSVSANSTASRVPAAISAALVRNRAPRRSPGAPGVVNVETKTKDNVFVTIPSRAVPGRRSQVFDAYYKLSNPRVRSKATSSIPSSPRATLTLDEAFEQMQQISGAVKRDLDEVMDTFGYNILRALVTDIVPTPK